MGQVTRHRLVILLVFFALLHQYLPAVTAQSPPETTSESFESTSTASSLNQQSANIAGTVLSEESGTQPQTTTETPSARESDTDTRVIQKGLKFESTRNNADEKANSDKPEDESPWQYGRGKNSESWSVRTSSNRYPPWKKNKVQGDTNREKESDESGKSTNDESGGGGYIVWTTNHGQGPSSWQVGNAGGPNGWPGRQWIAADNGESENWNAEPNQEEHEPWVATPASSGESQIADDSPYHERGDQPPHSYRDDSEGATVDGGAEEYNIDDRDQKWIHRQPNGWPGGVTNAVPAWAPPSNPGWTSSDANACGKNCAQYWNTHGNDNAWNNKGQNGWDQDNNAQQWPHNENIQWKLYNEDTQTMENMDETNGWKVIGDGGPEGWVLVDNKGNVEWKIENVNGEWRVSNADSFEKAKSTNNSTQEPSTEKTKEKEISNKTAMNLTSTESPGNGSEPGWDDEKGGRYVIWKFNEDGKGEARFYGDKGERNVWPTANKDWWKTNPPTTDNNKGHQVDNKKGNPAIGWNGKSGSSVRQFKGTTNNNNPSPSGPQNAGWPSTRTNKGRNQPWSQPTQWQKGKSERNKQSNQGWQGDDWTGDNSKGSNKWQPNTRNKGWQSNEEVNTPYIIIIKKPNGSTSNANVRKREGAWSNSRNNLKKKGNNRNKGTGRTGWQWNPKGVSRPIGSSKGERGWTTNKGDIYSEWKPTKKGEQGNETGQGNSNSNKAIVILDKIPGRTTQKGQKQVIILDYSSSKKGLPHGDEGMKKDIESVLKALKTAKPVIKKGTIRIGS